jgi:hypothetical protein
MSDDQQYRIGQIKVFADTLPWQLAHAEMAVQPLWFETGGMPYKITGVTRIWDSGRRGL